MKNTKIRVRIPRPMGVTIMSRNYNEGKDPKILEELREYIIKVYLANGFTLNGYPTSIKALSIQLQTEEKTIIKTIYRLKGHYLDVNTKESISQVASTAVMKTFETAFQNQNLMEQNIGNLMKAQQEMVKLAKKGRIDNKGRMAWKVAASSTGWVPGLQEDLNAALNAIISSQKSMQATAKYLTDLMGAGIRPGASININNSNELATNTNQYLTVEKAAIMISDQQNQEGQLLLPQTKATLAQTYLKDIPETDARKQNGYKPAGTSAIKSKKDRNREHEDRRENENGEVLYLTPTG